MNDARTPKGSEQPYRGPDIERLSLLNSICGVIQGVALALEWEPSKRTALNAARAIKEQSAVFASVIDAMRDEIAREPNAGSETRDVIASAPESSLPESNNQSETP